jgi:hypothetical protein
VVAKFLGKLMLPVMAIYYPGNESHSSWKKLLDVLFDEALPRGRNAVGVLTDGFPGLTGIINKKGGIHFRCVQHLSKSILKMCRGKSIHTELWRCSRAHSFPQFVKGFRALFNKNPGAAFFLCPPLAYHFNKQCGGGIDNETLEFDIVKKKILEQGEQLSNEPRPTYEEMVNLGSHYGIEEDELSGNAFALYVHLCMLIQYEEKRKDEEDIDPDTEDEQGSLPISSMFLFFIFLSNSHDHSRSKG